MNATSGAPAIIDIEASGFGRGSYPIEIGFVLSDGSSFCSLVQPAAHWTHWDAGAESVHGISRAVLQRHGRPALEVAQMLNDRLRGMTLYSDGWSQDFVWLNVLFEEAGRSPAFRLQHLALLLAHLRADDWNHARREVEQSLQLARHRASNDARVLQMTWRKFFQPSAAADSIG